MVFIIAFIIVSVSYGNIFFGNNHYVPYVRTIHSTTESLQPTG